MIDSKYSPSQVEARWYEYWMKHGIFHSEPDAREPYTIVIPPPNVTGVLHMGHMLNETIQDILVRRARMEGKNACWVPGTDHASIATENKVIRRLEEQGIQKSDLTREEFLRHAWDWTEEHGGIILKQLRRLGASCDWQRTAFTMDEVRSESVIRVFCDLYRKGLIYRGVRMVNWDPARQTALSDEEVIYKEEHGKLYYLKYYVEGSDQYAVVATTRPETIMGDVAMCINPADPKNQWLRGKKVIVPLVGRVIPVIEDEYVDIEFGTGCLKVTPAHDVNDYMLGEKHHLPSIDIMNDDGTISEAAGLYVGQDRFDVRRQIATDLEAAGLMERTEDYTNKVGCSERTGVPIEPKLSTQWFVRMKHFADIALPPVMNDEIRFHPAKYKNTYRAWLENIKDWCISRQLWWGHRIPAWYLPQEAGGGFVVAENEQEALRLAREKSQRPDLALSDLRQDEDALDTWFSSWLWPISLFDGIRNPESAELKYYYPTAALVTGPDIIFFWVARMIMAGYEYTGRMPFRDVYFTGIVRDNLGRKMSKSLGNSPDPLDLIDRYGADGVRMGMLLCAPAGNDILFDETLCEQGRNFCNKIWNAFRLLESWQTSDATEVAETGETSPNAIALEWFDARLDEAERTVADLFTKYRLSEALMEVYRLFRDDFSSWLLEMVKPEYGKRIDAETLQHVRRHFDRLLHLLHPFMPFITEELWQNLEPRREGEALAGDSLTNPELTTENSDAVLAEMRQVQDIIAGVRGVRQTKNVPMKHRLRLLTTAAVDLGKYAGIICRLAGVESIGHTDEKPAECATFLVGTTEWAVPLAGLVDMDAERAKAEAEVKRLQGFLAGIEKKLSNERFVSSAPAAVVELERKKRADALTKIAALQQQLEG